MVKELVLKDKNTQFFIYHISLKKIDKTAYSQHKSKI